MRQEINEGSALFVVSEKLCGVARNVLDNVLSIERGQVAVFYAGVENLDCSKCDAFKATQAEDPEYMRRIAERWTREPKTEFTPQDVECDGCWSQSVSGWCRRICPIQPRVQQRGIETCAQCSDYQCEKLKKLLSDEPAAREYLEATRKSIQSNTHDR